MLIRKKLPLSLQVFIGVSIGTFLGVVFGTESYLSGFLKNETLGQLGMLVIRLLKTLATPLIFVAILDAFIHTEINFRHGGRLLGICGFNLMVAMFIGLTIMNVFTPGESWTNHISELTAQLSPEAAKTIVKMIPEGVTLNPLKNVMSYIPENMLDPFIKNNVISVILMALLIGSALRYVKHHAYVGDNTGIHLLEKLITETYHVLLQMLSWVILAIPFAITGVVAQVVGKSGLSIFILLSIFLVTLLAGLFIHSLIYYPLMASVVGRMPIKRYFSGGADAILMGFSTNSSLATVPVTLRCLTEKMNVSTRSSRLSVLIGTNLNNDGIILYEAMTALFLAQALGFNLELSQQLLIVAAAVMVGAGVSGIPEAGLIALPLVLSTIGLSEQLIIALIPLIATIDWIIARCRSVVNVMSDMLVAILLDRFEDKEISAN
ncbi:dicarboxylate:amino acid:cation symporter DAACS family protein [Methylococcaceae bacterium]|nr:dicarboxylate:amino acid:cation symporter DAACS family protein [Methylococcaceae bacterium]